MTEVLTMDDALDVEVVVCGAGLSGLVAARRLRQNGMCRVVVLEAADQVGGRLLNQRIDGDTVVEGGGQWVGPGQDRVLALRTNSAFRPFPATTVAALS
nr:FAD-dependent oxidoreductase [Nocardia arizonensis]